MRCSEMEGLLVGLVGDDLGPAQEEFVQRHLGTCPYCQTTYRALVQTKAALASLGREEYQPQLTERVTQAIGRARTARTLSRWSLIAARVGGIAAALLLLFYAVTEGIGDRPAGPPPAPVYVIEGRNLIQVDLGTRQARRVGQLQQVGGHFLDGGLIGSGSLLSLMEVSPSGEPVPLPVGTGKVGETAYTILTENADAVMRRGSSLWLVYNDLRPGDAPRPFPRSFMLDRLDLATGIVDPDPIPKIGTVLGGLLSQDGRQAYLLAKATPAPDQESSLFVKVIDTESRGLVAVHSLPAGFDALSQMHLSPDGTRLYVTGQGRLLAIDLEGLTPVLHVESPDLTVTAALNPQGTRLLVAAPGGGLTVLDAAAGTVLHHQTTSPPYDALLWRENWIYAHHYEGIDLIRPSDLKVVNTVRLRVFGGWYVP